MITISHAFILLFPFIFFVFGLIIGSFLNVVIYRINTKKSLGGRSSCMSCQYKLHWYELIPIFSFLFLKGRCKNCQTKISVQYLLVEFVTGLIFSFLFLKFQNIFLTSLLTFGFVYLYYAIMFSLLIIIAVYDLRHKIIPDILSFVFILLAFVGIFFFRTFSIWELLSGVFIALPFYLLWLISRGTWMGLGDAKLALGLGYFLGFPLIFSAVVLSFWIGAIVGLFIIILSKIFKGYGNYGMKSEIPFAPYLVLGTLLAFFFNFSLFPL